MSPRIALSIAKALLLLGVVSAVSSCTQLRDDIRIRRDDDTLVKPDVDELEAYERSQGFVPSEDSESDDIDSFLRSEGIDPSMIENAPMIDPPVKPTPESIPATTPSPSVPQAPVAPPRQPQYDPGLLDELR